MKRTEFDLGEFVAKHWIACAIGTIAALLLLVGAIILQRPGAAPQAGPAASRTPNVSAKLLPGDTYYALDAVFVNGRPLPVGPAPTSDTLPAGQTIRLVGWASDKQSGKPASGVDVLIGGGKSISGTYGGDRPDVAKALNNAALERTGFSINLPPGSLSHGTQQISLKIYNNDGTGYYLVPDRLKLIVQ